MYRNWRGKLCGATWGDPQWVWRWPFIVKAQMNVDHIVPFTKDPSRAFDYDNAQVLCRKHNENKWTRYADYRPGHYVWFRLRQLLKLLLRICWAIIKALFVGRRRHTRRRRPFYC